MFKTFSTRIALAAAATLASSGAMAAVYGIDSNKLTNGLTGIFSTTFAGAPAPCTGASPSYCSFFGGLPSPAQLAAISIVPNPSGVTTATPVAISGAGAGSFLDLTLSGGNTMLTLNGGTITFGDATIVVVPAATTITTNDPGMVFDSTTPPTTAVNGLGQAEFLVTLASPFAIDFSAFGPTGAGGAATSCVGSPAVCGAVNGNVLFLDAVKYRLAVEWDPTFTQFNSRLIGQTSNASMIFANLDTVPVPAAVWLMGSALGVLGWMRRKAKASS